MSSYSKINQKPYITASLLCSGFLMCGAVYIYGVNESAIHTLAIEKTKKQIQETEEQMHVLEVERAHMTVGISLEKQAESQGLFATDAIHFVSRDSAVAQKN